MRARILAVATVVLVPLALLAGLEGGLRLVGVGYDPSFLVVRPIEGDKVVGDNPRFGWRFFPKAIARAPQPISVPAKKGDRTVRVCVLGGSAAMGDPWPAIGMPRHLQAMLEAARPDLDVQVVNAAMTAINSHVVLPIAGDCVAHGADVLVVYVGNNEVVGPFGAGSVFGVPGAGIAVARANVFVKSTRIGQTVDALVGALQRAGHEPSAWTGMELFAGTRLPLGDKRLDSVYGNFRQNLEDVARDARRAGVPVVLSSVAVNLRSCAPFASELSAGHDAADRERIERSLAAAAEAERAGDFAAALARCDEALAIDAGWAETSWRRARCLLALGRDAEAASAFARARDADVLRFRADSGIDAVLREVAVAEGVAFVDAAAAVAAVSPAGIPGHEHFDDHVHLNPDGNWIVARELARTVLPLLPPGEASPLPDAAACRRRLAYAPHHRLATVELMRGRRDRPPFTNQSDRTEWSARIEAEVEQLEPFREAPALRRALAIAREELARHPDDWDLRAVTASLLEEAGDPASAREERLALLRRFPYAAEPRYALGAVLVRLGERKEAAELFRECIELSPGHFLARSALGGLLREEGRLEEAAAEYEAAVRAHPDGAIGFRELGDVRLEMGRAEEALAAYDRAIAANPGMAAVHKKRGDALLRLGRSREAADAYREALSINPDYAAARSRLREIEEP